MSHVGSHILTPDSHLHRLGRTSGKTPTKLKSLGGKDKKRLPHAPARFKLVKDLCIAHGQFLESKSLSPATLLQMRSLLRSSFGGVLGLNKEFHLPVTYVTSISSTAGAVINNNFADNSTITSAAGWSPLSTFFDEFRIRAVQFWIEPVNKYSKTTTLSNGIVCIYDDDSNGTLSTYDLGYSDVHTSNTDDLWPQSRAVTFHKPNTAAYLNEWQTTAGTPAAPGGLMFYANTLSASILYGRIWIRYWCDFRQIG